MIQIDDRWLTDKSLHERLKANPKQELRQLGYAEELLEGKEFVVVTNTKDIAYIVIGIASDAIIDLVNIQAAATGCVGISTAACVASVGSLSSICTSAMTISTGSSAGTIATDSP